MIHYVQSKIENRKLSKHLSHVACHSILVDFQNALHTRRGLLRNSVDVVARFLGECARADCLERLKHRVACLDDGALGDVFVGALLGGGRSGGGRFESLAEGGEPCGHGVGKLRLDVRVAKEVDAYVTNTATRGLRKRTMHMR